MIEENKHWAADFRQAVFDPDCLGRIQRVLSYWKGKSYEQVALPWMAPEIAMGKTRPEDACTPEPQTHEGALVASAEQSFLWLESKNELNPGAVGHIGWTPCFRHEKKYDALHHHYFMKAELFVIVQDDPWGRLEEMMSNVSNSWRAIAILEGRVDLIPEMKSTGADSFDLMVEGIELGSYGVRELLNDRGLYLYGTAIAEPRWSNTWPRTFPV